MSAGAIYRSRVSNIVPGTVGEAGARRMFLCFRYSVLLVSLLSVHCTTLTDWFASASTLGDIVEVAVTNLDAEGSTSNFRSLVHVNKHLPKILDPNNPVCILLEAPAGSGMAEGVIEADLLALPDPGEGSTAIPVNKGRVSLLDKLGPLVVQVLF